MAELSMAELFLPPPPASSRWPRFRFHPAFASHPPRFLSCFGSSFVSRNKTDPDGARDGHVLEGLAGREQGVPLRIREKVD